MIIFIEDGKYRYECREHEIIIEKRKMSAKLNIINNVQNKLYSLEVTSEQLNSDFYFQSIKQEYNVLELFGLSDVELFVILVDNCIKKNKYNIKWFTMSLLNITNDNIKFTMNISAAIDISFNLDMVGYI